MLLSQAACRERLLELKLPLHNSEAFMGPWVSISSLVGGCVRFFSKGQCPFPLAS